MKNFARVSCFSARTDQSQRVGNNSDKAAADSYRAAGIPRAETYAVPGQPGTDLSLDQAELKQIAETWGAQFADCLIADRRWPTCNQPSAILAAGFVVERAIGGIVAILDSSADFKLHTRMMAETIHIAFSNSMPSSSKKGKSNAPTA
jgi:hypothetical protein